MPAYAQRDNVVRPRERAYALAAVVLVQAGLALALLSGFHVDLTRQSDAVERLIDIALPKPPPPPRPVIQSVPKPRQHESAAPKATPLPIGGSEGAKPRSAPASITPIVAVQPTTAPSGGGRGGGPAVGTGAGGGPGGTGAGDDEGGSDLEQIAGAITSADYPRRLREAGIGGRVSFLFTVEPNGRVGRCTVTRSSGVPELDDLTCRLIQQRFIYRPSTDRYGRPIEDEVEGEHDWVAHVR